MTPELAYFLKINVAIALFYAFYRLFFHKDTFFHWRRIALLCFFAISLLYPLLNIEGWIKAHEPMVAMADLYATIILPEQVVTIPQETEINWQELIKLLTGIIYWSGVLLLTTRFFLQLGSIMRLHFQCSKSQLKGVRVHLLKKEAGTHSANIPPILFRLLANVSQDATVYIQYQTIYKVGSVRCQEYCWTA